MKEIVIEKAWAIKDALRPLWLYMPDKFIVAGGAFRIGSKINDYDIYPYFTEEQLEKENEPWFLSTFGLPNKTIIEGMHRRIRGKKINYCKVLAETPNSLTFTHIDINKPIQFCRYYKGSLIELVKSFDFNNIQCGVVFQRCDDDDGHYTIHDYYYTDDYEKFAVTGEITYTGTEYPLSSLIRLGKQRTTRRETIQMTVVILADLLKRKFDDYGDFLDQLDAIDLSLAMENVNSKTHDALLTIFNELARDKTIGENDV
jgi:hypothetical protein